MNRTTLAMLLLVIGNALALISDAFVKAYSGDVPVAQFVLVRTLITLVFLFPFVLRSTRRRLASGWKVQVVRAQISVFGTICMVVALNHLSLATANAIFYAAPVIVMVLAVVLFKEQLTRASLTAVVFGFVGVLVILRPVEIGWQSLAAVGVAFSLAINVLLIRRLSAEQSPMEMLLVMHVFMLPALTVISLFHWTPVTVDIALGALGSSFFILCYNMTVLIAYRWAEANKITSSEYTGMIWAILGGWVVFGEVPDAYLLIGSGMIVIPLVWLALSEQRMLKSSVSDNHVNSRRKLQAAES
ncbi:DMT family transporter [Reinekea blandensis]|uniref:EamA domain-containing protein n=1 Tax=Reinekea blandensis MED297 TaxID=314283 RepID=A4BK26_9GAMM|nr:DMT family transporter [Reinekea blandensis]EAR07508.1 hypothetical protein MED297_06609 [Reinekea sp. MED297] [Reinekea blandensis MED297]